MNFSQILGKNFIDLWPQNFEKLQKFWSKTLGTIFLTMLMNIKDFLIKKNVNNLCVCVCIMYIVQVYTMCISNIQQSNYSCKHILYIWCMKIEKKSLWDLIKVSVFCFKSHTYTLEFIDVVLRSDTQCSRRKRTPNRNNDAKVLVYFGRVFLLLKIYWQANQLKLECWEVRAQCDFFLFDCLNGDVLDSG